MFSSDIRRSAGRARPRCRPHLPGERRIVDQRMPVGRDDFLQLALPVAGLQSLREALLDHPDHDRGRGRGAGRCAEKRDQRVVACGDDLRPEFQDAALPRVALDDLHAHSRHFELPVFLLRAGVEGPQHGEPMLCGLEHLADEVFAQAEIVQAGLHERPDVVEPNGAEQIEIGPVFEELGREAGVGPEQERVRVADHPGVEMRHRHRRRTDGGVGVDLGMMALIDRRVVAAQPDATDGEAGVTVALRYAGFLQEQNRSAAGAQKDELRGDGLFRAVLRVASFDPPAAAVATEVVDAMAIVDREAVAPRKVAEQIAGECAVVQVGAGNHPGRRDLLAGRTAFHHKGNPFGQRLLVLGELHPVVKVMCRECRMAFPEEAHIRGALHEAHMRHRMDERSRIHHALAHQVGPELARQIELDVDFQRLGNVDAAVGAFRGVVELAQRRVPGAGIVPGIRALERGPIERLEDLDAERRLELLEKRRERRAHDARADENDVRLRTAKSVHVPLQGQRPFR
jgi:hypothetical protein